MHECALGRSIHAAQIAPFGRKQAIRPAARLVDHSGGYARGREVLANHAVWRRLEPAVWGHGRQEMTDLAEPGQYSFLKSK